MDEQTADPADRLESRLEFETLLADLSSRFINLPPDELDREIGDALRRVCVFLDVDYAVLWQWSASAPDVISPTHVYSASAVTTAGEPLVQEQYPWTRRQMLEGRTVVLASIEDLPAEAEVDGVNARRAGIKSSLVLPIRLGGEPPVGALAINDRRAERDWPAALVKRLLLVAQVFTNALARRRYEFRQRENEERLALAADSAEAGLWTLDYDSGIFWATPRALAIFGYSPDETITMNRLRASVHPDDWDPVRRAIERSASVGEHVDVEYRIVPPGAGRARWISSRGRPVRDPDGHVSRLTGISLDVTERKEAERESRTRLEFESLIAELSSKFVNLPASEVDREILDAERRLCELLDLDVAAFWQWVDEAPGFFTLTHYYSPGEGPQLPAQSNGLELFPWFQRQLRAGRIVAISSLEELPAEAAGDREVCRQLGIKSNLSLPLSVAGEPALGVLGLNTSRSEREWPDGLVKRMQFVGQVLANALARKRSDQQLRESEEVNRATFEQAAVGLAHVGIDGRWLRVNDRLCAIVGYSREELSQLTFQDITHPEDLEADLDSVRQVLSGAIKTYSMEKRYLRKDLSLVWVSVTVSLARTATGEPRHFIAVVEDINERKQAEAESQQLRLQLWHADRVAQTGAITASLAHELNQPLTGILSTAQAGLRFMAGGNPALEEIRGILTDIVQDTKRAAAITNGVRAMLRHKETKRERIGLADTIREVLDLAHSELVGRQVQHRVRMQSDSIVLADKGQVQQVLLNLVMNALDAMDELPAAWRRLELTLTRTGAGEALVSMSDSGPGIPEDRQEKLFEAFWTTKREGLGIGLSISRSIVESHGGRLWFANNPDQGATFHFTLPQATDPDPRES